jgi:hypothetical protein
MDSGKSLVARSAAFGAGLALMGGLIFGLAVWWKDRPKPWSSTAITAKPASPEFQRLGEQMHIRLSYALKNNTSDDYVPPAPPAGALMRIVQKTSSMQKIDHVTWDSPTIPPHQSINVTFDLTYDLSDYGTSAAEIDREPDPKSDNLPGEIAFIERRFKEMNAGLVFLDYQHRFHVDMRAFVGAVIQ